MARAERIRLGIVGRAHGLGGDFHLFVPRMLDAALPKLRRVFLTPVGGERRDAPVLGVRRHGPAFLVRLEGVQGRTAAEGIRGAYVDADRGDLAGAGCEGPFIEDLVGLEVATREGRSLGTLEEVLEYPGGDLYRIGSGRAEILLPAVPEIILEIDWEAGRMLVAPPPGLLEINS
jgi:16S rRNA processing protein RimM